jgi:D-serine deaminase-like pyridoxal phosphate-dependent protein
MQARTLDANQYAIDQVEMLSTPRLVVYRMRLEQNISLMRHYLEEVVPGSGFRHLSPHVKTHKSSWVTSILLESGIGKFKCTPQELDLLLNAGAKDVFVAYPLLAHDADRLARSVLQNPQALILAQAGSLAHAEELGAAARRHGVEIHCLLDVDVGHHRTGMPPGQAKDVARQILSGPRTSHLKVRGIHAYDGHNSSADLAERKACSQKAMAEVIACVRSLEAAQVSVDRVVVGGTPGFLHDLNELVNHNHLDADVLVSPGTWVYWDTNYEKKMPGMFEFAALILTQVMDLPGEDRATLNLGYKRWGADQGPVELFSEPGLQVVSSSEEHTVLQCPGRRLSLGERVLIVPRHVCSTVNLWETFTVVDDRGGVEAACVPVTGRNR